jgi:hypothetical protein
MLSYDLLLTLGICLGVEKDYPWAIHRRKIKYNLDLDRSIYSSSKICNDDKLLYVMIVTVAVTMTSYLKS